MAKSKKRLQKIPTFRFEEDEREFWTTADLEALGEESP